MMERMDCYNFEAGYKATLRRILDVGSMTKPRGFMCREISPFTLNIANPFQNVVSCPVRKLNKGFAAAELFWIMNGQRDLETISFYNGEMRRFSDDGQILAGAYGPRLAPQLPWVYDQLQADPWTRQAVATIWTPNPEKSKDIPCTVMFHFLRRPLHKLNLIVYMRSNDAWLGLPYDVHNFTSIQILMAGLLGVEPGIYTHHVGSMHLYDTHFQVADECSKESLPLVYEDTPRYEGDWKTLLDELSLAATFDEWYRKNIDFVSASELSPFWHQKLDWMKEKARKKHAHKAG